ncbi:MAG: patatin-like phospholipase family protein [Betaproteobacteria bacterium]
MRRILAAAALVLLAACQSEQVAPERLPRFVPLATPPKVALVLGSGGPRGFAHIGVIKVLEEAGVRPDFIIGSSVGALVGALYASGYTAPQLEQFAYDLSMLEFFELSMLRGAKASGTPIQHYVNECVGHRAIEQLRIPFAAAVTRVSDRKLVLFTHGDTGLAVRASGADPDEFQPVKVGNDMYVDGDVVSPVPIHAARALGAKVVIAVDVSAFAEDTPEGVPKEWIDKDARRAAQVRVEAPQADVLLHPNIGYYAGYKESYRRRVIAAAEAYTRAHLAEIRAAFAHAGLALPVRQASSTALTPPGVTSR